jgi:hypothetical protein
MERKRRSLWGSISTSERADSLTDPEFLLYLLIIPHCDDDGRMQGKPKTVKNKTSPGREWNPAKIEAMLHRLNDVGLIEYYTVDEKRYIQVTQWEEHQTFHAITREKSKYPTNNGSGAKPTLVENETDPGSKRSEVKRSKEKRREEKPIHPKSEHSDPVIFPDDSLPMRLAVHLQSCILENNPKAKPPNLQKWAQVVDRMIRLDEREPDDIGMMIDWCQADEFWMCNILSPGKLREKWDQLWLKAKDDIEEVVRERRRIELARRRDNN